MNDPQYWLAMYCRYGSVLDANAAATQKIVCDALPTGDQERVRFIQEQEKQHSRVQYEIAERLWPGLKVPEVPYFRKIEDSKRHDPIYMGTWLAIAERLYVDSFRLFGRRAKQLGWHGVYSTFLDIAEDELNHSKLGAESVRILGGATPEIVREIGVGIDHYNEQDWVVAVGLPRGLRIPPFNKRGSQVAEMLLPSLVG